MTAEPAKPSTENPTSAKPEADKANDTHAPVDLDDFEAGAGDDDIGLPLEDEIANKKLAARRKIEMHWEKQRLKDKLGDLEEIDFDF